MGNWSYPTAIRFGTARFAELGDACRAAGILKSLLVTDRGLAGLDITIALLVFWTSKALGARSTRMSHPIGAVHGTHHGTTNAVCMPEVMKFNVVAIRARFDAAAAYLGIDGGFEGFCAFADGFNDNFAIPKRLSGLGILNPDIEALSGAALRDPSVGDNPMEMTRQNTRALFEAFL